MKKSILLALVVLVVGIGCHKENKPPTIDSIAAVPDSVVPNQAAALTANASDPNDDELTYTWATTNGTLSSIHGQSINWTAPAATGNYTISVTVEDEGGLTDEAGRSIKVYPAPDNQPPTVNITYPNDQDTIKVPSIDITADANDNLGINKVEFYVDNNKIGETSTAPYTQAWSITSYANLSAHSLYAKAYDYANNVGQSPIVTVTVKNRGRENGYNYGTYYIYDSTWTYDPVWIHNAPLQARIDTVYVAFIINHSYPADLYVQLRSPQNVVQVIYTYGNCPGGYISFATTYFAGGTVNGTWTLEIFDGYPYDTGNISYFEVGVGWKFP